MPGDRNLTIVYGVAASFAAVAVIYVISPTFTWDNSSSSSNQRRKGVVGLVNTANDCFINSVLQALAGLPKLRVYLIQRTQRAIELGEFEGARAGRPFLSGALKEILDNLNERPIHRKTISARPFLSVLEKVFQKQISRAQQDAQEFLQVVAETIAEEYRALKALESEKGLSDGSPNEALEVPKAIRGENAGGKEGESEGFPFEGILESEIECTRCQFKTKPRLSTFVVLTLPVPQKSSATLEQCLDSILSTEYIDDYQCDKCKLQNAIDIYRRKLERSASSSNRETFAQYSRRLEEALDKDPENPPADIDLPTTPRTRITKTTRISNYPNILAVHLSRSIYDFRSARRNSCKVSFPEELSVGRLLDRQQYKLHCVVIHKGGHDSGHYECFRRQIVYPPPFSTPSPLPATPIMPPTPLVSLIPSETTSLVNGCGTSYGATESQNLEHSIENPSRTPTRSPSLLSLAREENNPISPPPSRQTEDSELRKDSATIHLSPNGKDQNPLSPTLSSSSSTSLSSQQASAQEEPNPVQSLTALSSSPSRAPSSCPSPSPSMTPTTTPSSNSKTHKYKPPDISSIPRKVKKKGLKLDNKWWRISDDKIRETKTGDVLDQQKEVYLLFYQRVKKDREGMAESVRAARL